MPAGAVYKEMAITDSEITWMDETGIVEATDTKKKKKQGEGMRL